MLGMNFGKSMAAAAVFIAMAAFAVFYTTPVLDGEGKYFALSPSSSGVIMSEAAYRNGGGRTAFGEVRAESVFFKGECDIDGLLSRYRARVVLCERAGGVVNYYCRSTRLSKFTVIAGREVNLHIAVSEGGYTVGTPLIAAGY